MGLGEGGRKRAAAMWYLVGLPSYKNLVEAVALILARCRAEIRKNAQSAAQEELQEEAPEPVLLECAEVISVENWKPTPELCDERARLSRRAQRYDRYRTVDCPQGARSRFHGNFSPCGVEQANHRTVDQRGGLS